MNSLSDYIELKFAGVKNSDDLIRYKSYMLSEMRSRANQLQSRGLADQKVIYDLIAEEYPDPKSDFLKTQKKLGKKKKIRFKALFSIALGVVYILILTIIYLAYSFAADNWAKSWLIMAGGIILLIISAFFAAIKKALHKHRYKTARAFTAASAALLTVLIFLCSQVLLHIGKSYLIFIAAAALMIAADIILAFATKQKFAIINFLLGLPAVSALSYVSLALLGAVSWHPHWLIFVNAVVIDFIIIAVALIRNSKKYEEEEGDDLWKEN